MKNILFKLGIVACLTSLLFLGCKKDRVAITMGEFTVGDIDANGAATGTNTNYKGVCISTVSTVCVNGNGLNVSIAHNNGGNTVAVYNIPNASSGTFNITNAYDDFDPGSCKLFMLIYLGDDFYSGYTGTITKTGLKSFTFAIRMKSGNGKITRDIAGNGKY